MNNSARVFLLGTVAGIVVGAAVPDVPTSLRYLAEGGQSAQHTTLCWIVMALLIGALWLEYRRMSNA